MNGTFAPDFDHHRIREVERESERLVVGDRNNAAIDGLHDEFAIPDRTEVDVFDMLLIDPGQFVFDAGCFTLVVLLLHADEEAATGFGVDDGDTVEVVNMGGLDHVETAADQLTQAHFFQEIGEPFDFLGAVQVDSGLGFDLGRRLASGRGSLGGRFECGNSGHGSLSKK